MKIRAKEDFFKRPKSSCLIVPFFSTEDGVVFASEKIKEIEEELRELFSSKDFKAKKEEVVLLYSSKLFENRILLVGLGEEKELKIDDLRKCIAAAIKYCQKIKIRNVNLLFPQRCKCSDLYKAVLEGILLSNYLFDRFISEKDKEKLEECNLIGVVEDQKLIDKMEKIASGVYLTRDLVNSNADDATPKRLAEVAKELEKVSNKIKTTVLNKGQIEKEGMGLLYAVARGSSDGPLFIVVDYTPNPKSKDRVVLVGKGITYDTGGLCLKPPTSMDTMKCDMAGAACVLSTIHVAASLNLNVNVTAIVPACENAIDANSYKPGDVYRAYNKKTVEVVNTDAEGRLILADALAYAVKNYSPSCMINIATLTGAIVVALGYEIAGLFTNNDDLYKKLFDASQNTSELLWRMPLHQEYKPLLKSKIADLKNCVTTREASSVTAALFLEEFVDKIPWAHFDIGGTAYFKEEKGYHTTLATGYGVRLLIDFLENY